MRLAETPHRESAGQPMSAPPLFATIEVNQTSCAADGLLDDRSVFLETGNRKSIAAAIPVAISSAAGATTSSTLLWLVAVLTVNRPIPARLKRNSGGLSAASANDRCFGARAGVVTGLAATILLAVRARALLRLAARFTALGRRVTTLLKELLFHCGKYKFLPALAALKC